MAPAAEKTLAPCRGPKPEQAVFAPPVSLRALRLESNVMPGRKKKFLKAYACSGVYRAVRFGPMEYFSKREHDAMIVLDMTPAVRSLTAQPETFDLRITGRGRRYTPDFLVELIDGSLIWLEVKHVDYMVRHPQLDGRQPLIEAICVLRGGRFILWTDTEIYRQPRWRNVRRLRAAVGHVTADRQAAILELCDKHGYPVPYSVVIERAACDLAFVEAALGLCALGRLTLDLERPVDADAMLLRGPEA